MEPQDIDFAIQLTDLEGWGYSEQDFLRFMRMDPLGTLVGWDGSRRVGVTTATSYGEVAWIGSIIVRPEDRGKGYGEALVERALEYSRDQGAETCWLNAYPDVKGFYQNLEFKATGETIHLEGQAEGELQAEARLVHAGELDAISIFDNRYFGAQRLKVLREFYHDYGSSFLIWPAEEVVAYIVGAPYSGGVDVAPWVCDPSASDIAEKLFLHLLAQHPEESFGLNVPEENGEALTFLKSLGFGESFRTVRMYHGKGGHGIDPRGTFSLGGLEKG